MDGAGVQSVSLCYLTLQAKGARKVLLCVMYVCKSSKSAEQHWPGVFLVNGRDRRCIERERETLGSDVYLHFIGTMVRGDYRLVGSPLFPIIP